MQRRNWKSDSELSFLQNDFVQQTYLASAIVWNLEVENYEKEFQFQTSIRFNNQHTCGSSPTNSFKQRKEDEYLKQKLRYKPPTLTCSIS